MARLGIRVIVQEILEFAIFIHLAANRYDQKISNEYRQHLTIKFILSVLMFQNTTSN